MRHDAGVLSAKMASVWVVALEQLNGNACALCRVYSVSVMVSVEHTHVLCEV